ncbi:Dyp-type peroxidase [Streptomyces sp. TRM66268-LWL]|uniref:Dyp-type peroxidase n=1 Tax=Streptomyces polyasparticus TaxID=2767826 RepID=A0ABR7SDC1_9ACTN|nr:Dyp-type peroxidase [Streptomyces polyasparticus]MBC9712735.1 Dyp-type peroxidase [Streptomyces polyasparticus]
MRAGSPSDLPSVPARRTVLTGAGALTAALAAGCDRPARQDGRTPGPDGVPFHGARQAGVTTRQQGSVLLTAYDLSPAQRGRAGVKTLRAVLSRWTRVLATATEDGDGGSAEPGLERARQARLTVTVGIGPGLPERLGGLSVPAQLRGLPPLPGDRLDPGSSGGDVLVQVCADDAWTVAVVAGILTRLADGVLRTRWRQPGFLPPVTDGETPRNFFGFKDGTATLDAAECERWVWLKEGPGSDGTFCVVRRIHMRIAAFTDLGRERQEEAIGRRRASGAPLGRQREHDEVDLFTKTPEGRYVIPARAHVRAANPRLDGGARMLRRGYSYDNGPDDQGLLFLAFMRDPALFVRVQQRLGTEDDLSPFVVHRGSAVCYVLPGARPGQDLGATLF